MLHPPTESFSTTLGRTISSPSELPGDGRVVKINPEVAQADVKIGMSSILPHPMAGFGGGPKIVMPGVCNFEFIRDHHMRHTIHPRSAAGLTKGNPFHESCLKAAQAIGLDFSINCVYNQHGEVVRIIGGSLEAAFADAVEACYENARSQIRGESRCHNHVYLSAHPRSPVLQRFGCA